MAIYSSWAVLLKMVDLSIVMWLRLPGRVDPVYCGLNLRSNFLNSPYHLPRGRSFPNCHSCEPAALSLESWNTLGPCNGVERWAGNHEVPTSHVSTCPWRIHGAAIYGAPWIPSISSIYPFYVSSHIPAPWIRHGIICASWSTHGTLRQSNMARDIPDLKVSGHFPAIHIRFMIHWSIAVLEKTGGY